MAQKIYLSRFLIHAIRVQKKHPSNPCNPCSKKVQSVFAKKNTKQHKNSFLKYFFKNYYSLFLANSYICKNHIKMSEIHYLN